MNREELLEWLREATENPSLHFDNELDAVDSFVALCEQAKANFDITYRNGWVQDVFEDEHGNIVTGEPRLDESELGYRVGVDGRGHIVDDKDLVFQTIGSAAVAGLRILLRVLEDRPMGEGEE